MEKLLIWADLFDKYELNLSVNDRLKRDCGEPFELVVDICVGPWHNPSAALSIDLRTRRRSTNHVHRQVDIL